MLNCCQLDPKKCIKTDTHLPQSQYVKWKNCMLLTIRDMHTQHLAKYSHYIAGPCRRYLELRFENGGFQFRIKLYGSICRKIQFNSKLHGGELASNHPNQFLWRRKTSQDDDLKSIDMNWNVVMGFFFRKTFNVHGYNYGIVICLQLQLYLCMKMFEFRLIFHWILFLEAQLTIIQHWFW